MNGTKYNILFIMADQMRWDAIGKIGGYGGTPNLDRLCEEGIAFTNCMTNSPICSPARISLATGLYPHNTGVWRNIQEYDLPEDSKTWMQAVREAGYRTSVFGKTHLHHHFGDLRDREYLMRIFGFDVVHEIAGPRSSTKCRSYMTDEWEKNGVWEPYIQDFKERFTNKPYVVRPSTLPLELYYDVYVGQRAKEYIQNYDGDQPWFCKVSFVGPHEPWDTPEPYASKYDPKDMPAAIRRGNFLADSANRPAGMLDSMMKSGYYAPPLTDEEIAQMRANYAGNVTLIDDQIGEILQVLKDKGIYDRTVIVFVSDHGEMNGDHGLIYKGSFLNSSVKVPLIIRTPEMQSNGCAGSICNEMVELLDLGPTICDIAGGRLHHQQFGKSLVNVLRNPHASHREEAVSEFKGEVMLSTQEWKIVLNKDGEAYQLYHLAEDPNEQRNLVSDPQWKDVAADLKNRLLARLISTQVFLHQDKADETGIYV